MATAHRSDDVEPREAARDDADAIAHVAAIAGEVRDQLDEEGEQREEHEAPVERPVLASSLAHDEPRRDEQQGQRDDEPDAEDPKLLPEPGAFVAAAGGRLQCGLRLALRLERLIDLQQLPRRDVPSPVCAGAAPLT